MTSLGKPRTILSWQLKYYLCSLGFQTATSFKKFHGVGAKVLTPHFRINKEPSQKVINKTLDDQGSNDILKKSKDAGGL